MGSNRITPGGAVRRALLFVAAVAFAAAFAGCGSGGGGATAEKAGDVEILNHVLGRELAAVVAYERVLPMLRGADLALARQFRAQEQEHVDAILKALRGLGAKAEPDEEEIERGGLESRADVLGFLYELEGVSIDGGLRAISKLTAPWPRSLVGSIVTNQGQHLVLLRRALGARPLALIPDGFENGTAPPPAAGNGELARSPSGRG